MPPRQTKKTNLSPIPVSANKHPDMRKNIPTEELRDFVAEDEKAPLTLLYRRDPSLDPQLVWKGKDEQDRQELAVAAPPIYIQEKIHPLALVEDLRAQAKKAAPAQFSFFDDFNGLEFDELVEFYQHEQHWSNRLILGDSLQVMASLAEKEGPKGQVQMIYLDPPYGIKFGSNWQVSTRKREVKDGKAEDATRQPEQIKAFRDTWELGIHSYLAYLRDRLALARELLTESGSVFVQIGDENVHLVRSLLDEVFGSENFISLISFRKTTGVQSNFVASVSDYLIWYSKSKENAKFRPIYRSKIGDENYHYLMLEDGSTRSLYPEEISGQTNFPPGSKLFRYDHPDSPGPSSGAQVFCFHGKNYLPPTNRHWSTHLEGMKRLEYSSRIVGGQTLSNRRYLDDFNVFPYTNFWDDTTVGGSSDRWYVVQTTTKVIERCMLMCTDPGDLVLDPTCGSGTTAYVAEEWGRRWITVDTSRVALALARTRLMAAKFPYYLLADSLEGRKKERELVPDIQSLSGAVEESTTGSIKKGFVYERVPHITLKSIANNEEIDSIHARWQEELEPLREKINRLAGKQWEEWEMPRALTPDPSPKGRGEERTPDPTPALSQGEREQIERELDEWWNLRRQRQAEIDASIAKRAETELLYDKPYSDNKRVRVSGPFSVESLSPHRVLATNEERPETEQAAARSQAGDFASMILDNLKKAGVQNTRKEERLKFTRLDLYPGEWLQAAGEYEETTDGKTSLRRAAVCIGPEHGTVGPLLVKKAAKEAVKGVGFDLLIVCGFAFDPHVSEEAQRYGQLTVLPVRMNPDLAMGDTLLKKTGAGNLFMVFGEPDITITKLPGEQVQVEIKGLDIYDPTTGVIRSSSTDDIACWFIDSAYNEESFFVRQAYFTGADKPYEKLQKALRAEIDEAAWEQMYATKSHPFARPETGKIAVKVINHYGDEVLKVYEV